MASVQAAPDASRGAISAPRGWLDAPSWLFIAYIAFAFVGTHPFAEISVEQRLEGNIVDRVAVLGIFAFSIWVAFRHWRAAVAVLIRNPGLVFVMTMCMASMLWSDYPSLTLRRSLLFFFLNSAAASIAISFYDIRRAHTILFVCLAAVIVLNLVSIVVSPSSAITDIGVRGLYTQKNVAGYVAMISLVTGALWIVGSRAGPARILGAMALVLIAVFLVLTRSKTSIALSGLALVSVAALSMTERAGPKAALFLISGAALVLALALCLFAATDFDLGYAISKISGDSSFSGRDELWAFAWDRIGQRPWLGHGYGAFWDVGLVNDPLAKLEPGTWLGDVEVGTINQAHNGYLELCLHIGIPATIVAVFTVLIAALTGARRALSTKSPRPERAAYAAFTAILFLNLLHNQTEATLFMRGSPFWSIAVVALLLVKRPRFLALAPPRGASR